jgi:hypothetical protein
LTPNERLCKETFHVAVRRVDHNTAEMSKSATITSCCIYPGQVGTLGKFRIPFYMAMFCFDDKQPRLVGGLCGMLLYFSTAVPEAYGLKIDSKSA